MFTRKWAGNHEFAKGRGNNRKAQLLHSRKIYYLGGVQNVVSKALLIVFGVSTFLLM